MEGQTIVEVGDERCQLLPARSPAAATCGLGLRGQPVRHPCPAADRGGSWAPVCRRARLTRAAWHCPPVPLAPPWGNGAGLPGARHHGRRRRRPVPLAPPVATPPRAPRTAQEEQEGHGRTPVRRCRPPPRSSPRPAAATRRPRQRPRPGRPRLAATPAGGGAPTAATATRSATTAPTASGAPAAPAAPASAAGATSAGTSRESATEAILRRVGPCSDK